MASEKIPLPDEAEEVASFADFSSAYLTVNRAPDGTVYLVRWWFGTPTVELVVRPDGTTEKEDDE
jgi:hypothetical protein